MGILPPVIVDIQRPHEVLIVEHISLQTGRLPQNKTKQKKKKKLIGLYEDSFLLDFSYHIKTPPFCPLAAE